MVFTVPVTARTSRRRVLTSAVAAGFAGSVGGCGLFDDDPVVPPPPDALTPLYDAARAMADAYGRTVVAYPGLTARLTPIAQAHQAHADALAQIMSPPPPPSGNSSAPPSGNSSAPPSGGSSAPPTGGIAADERAAIVAHRDAERQAAKDAAAACRQTTTARATLVGTIAAARAAHAEALR